MKNFLLLGLFAISTGLFAQNKIVGFSPYGRYGEANSGGSVFEANLNGSAFKVLKNFTNDGVFSSDGDLVLGPDHFFYGLEGRNDGHVPCLFFYKIDPNDWSHTLLCKIEGQRFVKSSLVWGDDGHFYFCGSTAVYAEGLLIRVTTDGQTVENLVALPKTSESYRLEKISTGKFALALPDNRLVSYTVGTPNYIVLKQFSSLAGETLDHIGIAGNGVIYGAFREPQANTRLFKINQDGTDFSFLQTTPIDTDFGDVKDFLFWNDSTLFSLSPNSNKTDLYRVNLNTGQTHSLYANFGNVFPSKLTRSLDGYILFSSYTGASMGAVWKAKPDGTQLIKYQVILPQEIGLVGKVEELADGKLCMKAGTYRYEYSIQPGGSSSVGTNNIAVVPSKILTIESTGCCPITTFNFGNKMSMLTSPNNLIKSLTGKYYGSVYHGGEYGQGYIYSMDKDGGAFEVILNFQDEDINFDHAAFFEGSDARIYFGTRKKLLTYIQYNLFSVKKDGSDRKLLHTSLGAATSSLEASDGRLYWVNGFYLAWMQKDGTELQEKWKIVYSQFEDQVALFGRLIQLPNGSFFGGIDYMTDDNNYCYYHWLSFFLQPDGTLQVKSQDFKSEGYVAGHNGKVLKYDFEIDPVPFVATPTEFTVCDPISGGQLLPGILNNEALLWGHRTYLDGRFDMLAVNTIDKNCAFLLPWNQQMGYNGQFAFEKSPTSSSQEVDMVNSVRISPNPSHSLFQVECMGLTHQISWHIFNSIGKIVHSGTSNAPTFEVDITSLPSGVYQLVGQEEKSGRKFSQKVAKL